MCIIERVGGMGVCIRDNRGWECVLETAGGWEGVFETVRGVLLSVTVGIDTGASVFIIASLTLEVMY